MTKSLEQTNSAQKDAMKELNATLQNTTDTFHAHRLFLATLDNSQNTQIIALQTTNTAQEHAIKTLTSNSDLQHSRISSLNTTLMHYQTELTSLKDVKNTQASSLHVESGILDCNAANTWTDGRVTVSGGQSYPTSKHIRHHFTTPYVRPPVVFLADSYRVIYNTDGGRRVWYGTGVMEVTTTYFIMACGAGTRSSTDGYNSFVNDLEVNWLSVEV